MTFSHSVFPSKPPETSRRPAVRRGGRWRGYGWLLPWWIPFAVAAQLAGPSEYQVKAAFLYNFGKFVEWPSNTFAGSDAPLVIGIYGADPFHGDLERIVAGKNIDGHSVQVRQAVRLSDLKNCGLVFIGAGEQKHTASILAALKGAGVLTVTENMGHFSESGVMIDLFVEDDKVRFEINETVAEQNGLKISPKLLNLARRPRP